MKPYEVEWTANGKHYSKTFWAITSKDAVQQAKNEGINNPTCDKVLISIVGEETIDYSYIWN